MPPQTFYGIGPLQIAVSFVAIFNMVSFILGARTTAIDCFDYFNHNNVSGQVRYVNNGYFDGGWENFEWDVQVTGGIIIYYLLGINVSWIVLELIALNYYRRPTFMLLRRIPLKLYVWLMIYYSQSLFLAVHATCCILTSVWYLTGLTYPDDMAEYMINIDYCNVKLIRILFIILEVHLVHSYYVRKRCYRLVRIISTEFQ